MPTEQKVTRKLKAILSADVKGYSLLMADDEAYTIRKLEDYRTRMSNLIRANSGRVVDAVGDNLLAEFSSAVDAVQCAVEIQKALKIKNAEIPEDKRLNFRIGINIGDVVQDGGRIYGSGVNVAARIEGLADPDGVSISRSVYDQIKDKLTFGYKYLGDHEVKNIKDPVRVYKVLMDPQDAGKLISEAKKRPKQNMFMIGIAAVIIIALGVVFWQFYMAKKGPTKDTIEQATSSLKKKPSIAVLPFDNMSNDLEQEYFSDGITDNIITDLSKLSGLMVISRNSTFTYKGKEVKVPEVAKELGVRYILEGSIQKAANQIRINAQLIDSQTDSHIWADRFDGTMENIFELQDSITDKIVSELAVKLTPEERGRILDKGTKNISAYDVYLKGSEHYEKYTPHDYLKSIEFYKQALKIDPDFTRVYERLAEVYWNCNLNGFFKEMMIHPFTARLKARYYLNLAFENRDPTFRAYTTAAIMAVMRRQYDDAINLAEKGLKLAPNEWSVNFALGAFLNWSGKPEEGIVYINKSIEMDPRNAIGWKLCELGRSYFVMGELEKAIEYINRGQKINPRLILYSGILAASYAHLDRQDEAKAEIDNYLKIFATFHVPSFAWLNYVNPYKNYDVFDRFATGLAKAGYPKDPKAYFKVYEKNKLTEEEIKKIYSPPIKLLMGGEGEGVWCSYHENGEAYFDKPHPYFGSPSKGKWWINGDMVCSQWETIFDNLTDCGNIYHVDESDGPSKYKYIRVSDLNNISFRIE